MVLHALQRQPARGDRGAQRDMEGAAAQDRLHLGCGVFCRGYLGCGVFCRGYLGCGDSRRGDVRDIRDVGDRRDVRVFCDVPHAGAFL
ncbi:hypothetical protein GCM10017771_17920 [Streptomyces capitiformicae]|uniref:Uncharacterized protein n=1 Tax=Streptomyces capitiformicae TaxID=2014920 RepID=A0A919GIJ6_9ACTN|nr:hypothetical protein GCM10017771_17920 [Streptomyces capitiformicae]